MRIPEYDRRVPAQFERLGPRADAASFGGGAAGLDIASRELASVAAEFQRNDERSQTLDLSRRLAEEQERWALDLRTRTEQAPPGAPGFTDRLSADLEQSRARFVEASPEKLRPFAEARFASFRASLVERAAAFEGAARSAKRKSDYGQAVDAAANAVRTDDGQFEVSIGNLTAAASALLPAERDAMLAQGQSAIARSYFAGLAERDPHRAMEELKSGRFDAMMVDTVKSAAVNDVGNEIRRREAEARAAQREARAELRLDAADAITAMNQGVDPGRDTLVDLASRARAVGDGKTAKRLADAEAVWSTVDELRRADPVSLQNWVNERRSRLAESGGTGRQAREIRAAEQLLETMSSAVAKDPLSWAARVGVAKVEPISLFDRPQDPVSEVLNGGPGRPPAGTTIRRRIATAEAVAGFYGVRPRYLTDEEADQIKAQIAGSSVDGRATLIGTIGRHFGARAPEIYRELKINEPVFAHVGGLASLGASTATIRDALAGQAAREKGEKIEVQDRATWANDEMKGALGLLPETRAAVLQTADAIHHVRALRAGKAEGGDDKIYRRALQEALGATYDAKGERRGGLGAWNGAKLVLPAGVTERDFRRRVEKITDAELAAASLGGAQPAHGNDQAFKAKELRDAYLISVGAGRYALSMTDPADGSPQFLKGSGPAGHYVLDWHELNRRREEPAFDGGAP